MNQVLHWRYLVRIMMLLTTVFGVVLTANAHTGLKESTPGDGAVVRTAPEQVRLEFNAAVSLVRFELHDHDGAEIALEFKPSTDAMAVYQVPVAHLAAGSYHVEWAAIGEDGHTVTGEFGFTIDPHAEMEHGGHHAEAGGHAH